MGMGILERKTPSMKRNAMSICVICGRDYATPTLQMHMQRCIQRHETEKVHLTALPACPRNLSRPV